MSLKSPRRQHGHAPRNHGIDYLRASMMLVVVVAHVALSYQTYPEAENMMSVADIGDRYRNPDRTELAQRLHQVAHGVIQLL